MYDFVIAEPFMGHQFILYNPVVWMCTDSAAFYGNCYTDVYFGHVRIWQ